MTRSMAAVVFDLDGTLLDTMTSMPSAYADTIRSLGGPGLSRPDIVRAWHLGPTPAILAHFLGRPATADDLACFDRHVEAAIATARPFPGVLDMLTALDHAGHRLGLFTGASRRATDLMLAVTGIDQFFPTVVCGDEVSRTKPAPDGLELACRRMDVPTTDTIYVGDADVDLQCARSAGALGIHAVWGGPATSGGRSSGTARYPRDVIAFASGAPLSEQGDAV